MGQRGKQPSSHCSYVSGGKVPDGQVDVLLYRSTASANCPVSSVFRLCIQRCPHVLGTLPASPRDDEGGWDGFSLHLANWDALASHAAAKVVVLTEKPEEAVSDRQLRPGLHLGVVVFRARVRYVAVLQPEKRQ